MDQRGFFVVKLSKSDRLRREPAVAAGDSRQEAGRLLLVTFLGRTRKVTRQSGETDRFNDLTNSYLQKV